MKVIIKWFINKPIINWVFRNLLKSNIKFQRGLIKNTSRFIPVSGVIALKVEGVKLKFECMGDDHFITKSFYNGLSEANELRLYKSLSTKANIVFDIGANVGLYSIFGAHCNSDCNFYAFEPDNFIYDKLIRNIKRNDLENIKCYKNALGEIVEEKDFYSLKADVNTTTSSFYKDQALQYYPNEETIKYSVKQTTIDDLVYDELKVVPDLLKIDVELNELNTLKGATKTLTEHKPVILMEIFNYDIKTQLSPTLKNCLDHDYTLNIEELLKNFGYYFYIVGHTGILKVKDFRSNPDLTNYILSTFDTNKSFYNWKDVEIFASEIMVN